ncbi:heterokaryon incompatibility protein-domain-containing protein, partial [Podospora aff. communis PSN243]
MRLINTDTLALEEFINARDCPKYAILSHRWLRQELTYQEYQDEAKKQRKPESLGKVRKACDLARGRNHAYIWIDTCCIDKSSSAEISEAVNCMFAWYRGAEVCYAYMSDVQPGYNVSEMLEMARMGDLDQSPEPTPLLHVPFHKSEWFTRGWTLQELIVPPEVEFFAHDWSRLGTRSEMAPIITKACGVDAYALTPGVDLNWVSVARKMYWASSRTTSRDEDLAYCLLGIFDVNMPLLYGEGGARAFLRLQEEIVRRSNDQSIFAWDHLSQHPASRGPFAASPRAF